MNYGVIGCGGAGVNRHLSNALVNPSLDVRAVCDLDEERARSVADEHDTAWYTDAVEMIESEGLDGVSVATPPGTHKEVVEEIVPHDVDILVEKPFERTLERATAMLDACEERGTRISEVNNQRFQWVVQEAVRRVEDGAVGDVKFLYSNVGHEEFGTTETVKADWVTEIDGERFGEDLEHRIYLAREFIGDVRDASFVDSVTDVPDIPYDTAETGIYLRGDDANAYVGMGFQTDMPSVFVIAGTEGTILVNQKSRYVMRLNVPGGPADLFATNFRSAKDIVTQTIRRGFLFGKTVGLRALADRGIVFDDAYETSGHYQQLTELATLQQEEMTVTPDDIRNNVRVYEEMIDCIAERATRAEEPAVTN